MIRTNLLLVATCLAAAAAALQPASARAAEEDVQAWAMLNLKTALDSKTGATFTFSPRFRQDHDVLVLSVALDRKVSDWLNFGGGLSLIDSGGPPRWRPYQYVTLGTGGLTLRSRLDESEFKETSRTEIRLRERLQLVRPLSPDTKGTLSAEWFYTLRSRDPGGRQRTDQWRFAASVDQKFSPAVTVGAGYQAMLKPVPGGTDRLTHIPQITSTISF